MRVSVKQAIQLLRSGQVVAMPTETVYGLAACLDQPVAIEQIFQIKGRPSTNPLIIHVADIKTVVDCSKELPPHFKELAEAFWPGPLTLIVPIQPERVPASVRSGLPTAGFRMPQHPLALEVLKETGPLVMPSANLSGKPSATRPEHVEEDFGRDFPVLDGGGCDKGVESTILYYQHPRWVVVRLGALAPAVFALVLGYQPENLKAFKHEQPLCPGQLFRHYAPRAKLILGDREQMEGAPFILGFKERSYPLHSRVLYLGSLLDAEEVAVNLYQALRQLDFEGARVAWVDMDFPREGLWETIAERLLRAGEG
ncbi:L-threonylcarbamoyladenylate synthase [Candidatus Protochlamydia phocaeensis]|uniref:L-threonylcarbamoyladenylate synthase n=1 Tax=Candidatus Protochlamydia phocaeensis TaxID=1414722 RepID=UPI0008380DF9|nr:L-threonylcarbamoyladenylate synthase [Candidatus Protochlamydia phocaeensis]